MNLHHKKEKLCYEFFHQYFLSVFCSLLDVIENQSAQGKIPPVIRKSKKTL
jgi:hypothetical protein